MPSRAWPDSARAIINSALKVRISAVRLLDHPFQRGPVLRFVLGGAQRLLGAVAQPRERRLEIVGDVVGDLLEAMHQRLDALEHDVEIAGQPVELVIAAGRSAAARRGRRCMMRLGGVGHGVDAPEHPACDEEAAGDAEHDHERDRPAAGADDDVVQPLALLEIAADQQAEAAGKLHHAHQRVVLGCGVVVLDAAIGGLGPAATCRACRWSASRYCR